MEIAKRVGSIMLNQIENIRLPVKRGKGYGNEILNYAEKIILQKYSEIVLDTPEKYKEKKKEFDG